MAIRSMCWIKLGSTRPTRRTPACRSTGTKALLRESGRSSPRAFDVLAAGALGGRRRRRRFTAAMALKSACIGAGFPVCSARLAKPRRAGPDNIYRAPHCQNPRSCKLATPEPREIHFALSRPRCSRRPPCRRTSSVRREEIPRLRSRARHHRRDRPRWRQGRCVEVRATPRGGRKSLPFHQKRMTTATRPSVDSGDETATYLRAARTYVAVLGRDLRSNRQEVEGRIWTRTARSTTSATSKTTRIDLNKAIRDAGLEGQRRTRSTRRARWCQRSGA